MLIAIRPVVLEGAFAAILRAVGVDDVLQYHGTAVAERAGSFAAAVVSADLAADVVADVVITLPEIDGTGVATASACGHVTSGNRRVEVDIRDERQVIDLLDEHVPTSASRRSGLVLARTRSSA